MNEKNKTDKNLVQRVLRKHQEEKNELPELKVIQGGKEPPSTDVNWLDKMEIGSCFLAKLKGNPRDPDLELFRLCGRTEKSVVLQSPKYMGNRYIVTDIFCNLFYKHEDLGILEVKEGIVDESNRIAGDRANTKEVVE